MPFNPDAYLAKTVQSSFDPDAYLNKSSGTPSPSQEVAKPSNGEGEAKGYREASEKGQVYVKPIYGLSAEQTAGLYSWAESAASSMQGIGQLLGIGNDTKEKLSSTTEGKLAQDALLKNKEYKTGATVGAVAGVISDPVTYAIPLAKAKTLGAFVKQSALIGGGLGLLGPTTGTDAGERTVQRLEHGAEGVAGGAVGGALLGQVMRSGGKLFGKDFLPWKATPEQKAAIVDDVAKETGNTTEEANSVVKHFMDAPEDAHINAKAKAETLIEKGAANKEVAAAVEKNPLVGHYLQEYRTRYDALKESRLGEVSQGEVLPAEAPKVNEAPRIGEQPEAPISPQENIGEQKVLTSEPLAITDKSQQGSISPQLAANVAGTITGAALDPSDPIVGAAIGLGITHGGGRLAAKVAENLAGRTPIKDSPVGEFVGWLSQGADKAGGFLMTRLENESPILAREALDNERRILKSSYDGITIADKFFQTVEKDLPKEVSETIKGQWLNGSIKNIEESLANHPEGLASFKEMQATIKSLGTQMKERGILNGVLEDYLPRIVKDREGLLKSLDLSMRTKIGEAVRKAEIKNGGQALDDLQYAEVVNKFLRSGAPSGSGKAGFTKSRVFDTVGKDSEKFYYDPIETYHTYVSRANSEIHTADFFGKSKVVADGILDVNASIGNKLNELKKAGKIKEEQFDAVKSLLETRYKFGNQIANKYVQEYKNWSTGFLLADVGSSIQNLGDLVLANFIYGMKPALAAITQKVSGKSQLSVKDYGLTDHIAEEFVSTVKSKRYVDRAMRLSGWSILDPLGKEVALNSSLIRGQNWAKSDKGVENLTKRYENAFGSDLPQLIKDLQSGKVTDLTKSMAFWDVIQHQPLTKLQKTEFATKNPNVGGLMYMFKSFMLSQANLMRVQVYNQIRDGHRTEGLANLAKIGIGFAAVGAMNSQIQNFLLGRDEPFDKVDLFWNATKEFGATKYTWNKIQNGEFGKAAASIALPPTVLTQGWIKKDAENGGYKVDEPGVVKKMPIIGREVSARMQEAKIEREKMLTRLKNLEGRDK